MRETPVTVTCDRGRCPEVLSTLAQHYDDRTSTDAARLLARDAALSAAVSAGWVITPTGQTMCPLHAHNRVVLP